MAQTRRTANTHQVADRSDQQKDACDAVQQSLTIADAVKPDDQPLGPGRRELPAQRRALGGRDPLSHALQLDDLDGAHLRRRPNVLHDRIWHRLVHGQQHECSTSRRLSTDLHR